MTELPRFLQRAPHILYVTAAIVFIIAFALNVIEMKQTAAYSVPEDPLVTIAKLRIIYSASLDAIFVAANGLMIHVLLAIWDRLPIAQPPMGEDQ
jgi:hypothetical protein